MVNRRTFSLNRSTRLLLLTGCLGGLLLVGCTREPRQLVSRFWSAEPGQRSAPERGPGLAKNSAHSTNPSTNRAPVVAQRIEQARPHAHGRTDQRTAANERRPAAAPGRVRVVSHRDAGGDSVAKQAAYHGRAGQNVSWADRVVAQDGRPLAQSHAGNSAIPDSLRRVMTDGSSRSSGNDDLAGDEWDWTKTPVEQTVAQTAHSSAAGASELRRRVMTPTTAEAQRDRWDGGASPAQPASERTADRPAGRPVDPAFTRFHETPGQSAGDDNDLGGFNDFNDFDSAAAAPSFCDNGMVVESSEVAWRFPYAKGRTTAAVANRPSTLSSARQYGEFQTADGGKPRSSEASSRTAWEPVSESGVVRVSANNSAAVLPANREVALLSPFESAQRGESPAASKRPASAIHPLYAAEFDDPAPEPPVLDDELGGPNSGRAVGAVRVLEDLPAWQSEAGGPPARKSAGTGPLWFIALGLGIAGLLAWRVRRKAGAVG